MCKPVKGSTATENKYDEKCLKLKIIQIKNLKYINLLYVGSAAPRLYTRRDMKCSRVKQ